MKFLVLFAAVCIGAAVAEVSQEEQILHEKELTELCQERGVFANPHDPEGRTFIRCELEPIELRCDEEFIFDSEKLMCVEKPQPPAPVDLNAVNWQEVLTCPDVEDKYFRNPYDCSRFYRCYKQGEFSRLDANRCLPTMIFDEVLETCLPAEQFRSYYGHSCENAPLPELNKETEPEIPEKKDETEPEKQDETEPEKQDETEPEKQDETEPEKQDETEPEKQDETEPEKQDETEPEKQDETEPEKQDETEPEKQDETEPEKQDETEPEKQDETQPEQQEETQPEKQDEVEPEVVPEEKEQEKVPTLNEILKQIKDMFKN